jgi:hypothetical protein
LGQNQSDADGGFYPVGSRGAGGPPCARRSTDTAGVGNDNAAERLRIRDESDPYDFMAQVRMDGPFIDDRGLRTGMTELARRMGWAVTEKEPVSYRRRSDPRFEHGSLAFAARKPALTMLIELGRSYPREKSVDKLLQFPNVRCVGGVWRIVILRGGLFRQVVTLPESSRDKPILVVCTRIAPARGGT